MITPSTRTAQELQKSITEPIVLSDLLFTPALYICTRGPITYDGQVYQAAQFDVSKIEYGDYGEQRATLRVSALLIDQVLNPGVIDKTVKVQMLWGQEPFDPGDSIELIEGVIGDVSIGLQWIDLHVTELHSTGVSAPRVYYDHQNIQPAGTTITLRSRTITIERAERV